jgi:hypothetical protein
MCTCTARKLGELHRRAQAAEGIIARSGIVEGRPQMAAGRSMGRALANYAAAKYERERDEAYAVLRLIANHVGCREDEAGTTCTGSWCAEQARAFLHTSNNAVSGGGVAGVH